MSNSAWCGLKGRVGILKLLNICHNSKCKCQKQITFTSRQFQLEGASLENTRERIFNGNSKSMELIS